MRYLLALACLLIVPAETSADVVIFPGAVGEGYSAVSEVKGDLELPEAKTESTGAATFMERHSMRQGSVP